MIDIRPVGGGILQHSRLILAADYTMMVRDKIILFFIKGITIADDIIRIKAYGDFLFSRKDILFVDAEGMLPLIGDYSQLLTCRRNKAVSAVNRDLASVILCLSVNNDDSSAKGILKIPRILYAL